MADQPAQLGTGRLGERSSGALLVHGLDQAHLDELVVVKRLVDGPDHTGAEARLADLHDRPQMVGATAQELLLVAGERHGRPIYRKARRPPLARGAVDAAPPFGVASAAVMGWRPHRRTRATLLVALALLLAQACAKPPPAHPPAVPTAPPVVRAVPSEPAREPPAQAPVDEKLLLARSALGEQAAERLDGEAREAVAEEVAAAEREHGLPTLLLLALIAQESSFDPQAVGPSGSIGLMQIRLFVAEDVAQRRGIPFSGRSSLFDPGLNVRIGSGYLAELHGQFGSYELALAAYNKGPSRVRRDLRRGRRPARRFVEKVMSRYERFRARYELPSVSAAE